MGDSAGRARGRGRGQARGAGGPGAPPPGGAGAPGGGGRGSHAPAGPSQSAPAGPPPPWGPRAVAYAPPQAQPPQQSPWARPAAPAQPQQQPPLARPAAPVPAGRARGSELVRPIADLAIAEGGGRGGKGKCGFMSSPIKYVMKLKEAGKMMVEKYLLIKSGY